MKYKKSQKEGQKVKQDKSTNPIRKIRNKVKWKSNDTKID